LTLAIAVLMGLLGLALIVVGIVALRDDAPRWTLKINRPGWLLFLGFVVVGVALLVNAARYNIEDDVKEAVGREVKCDKVGALVIDGQSRDVYACEATGGGSHLGCFARVGEQLVDVSREAERPGALGPGTVDC
jgi:hypothetical protein